MAMYRPLVVLIDDDPEILRSLQRALKTQPWEILVTEHPAQVLRWITERPVDLVLSDQRMPEMNGTDLLEIVRDYSPSTACVILSGFPDTALIVEESGVRIERLIAKPWDNAELATILEKLLDERKPSAVDAASPRTVFEVECAGRTARQVVTEILPICSRGQATGDRPVIALRNLRLLGDSVSRLLKGLARAVAWSHFPIDLRDESGALAAFLSALGRPASARK